jgi:hypothetical protein
MMREAHTNTINPSIHQSNAQYQSNAPVPRAILSPSSTPMGGADDNGMRTPKTLTREQKITVGVLLVCGVIACTLSVLQIRRALNRPFTASLDEFIAFQRKLGPTDAEKERQLQETDTDGDGISDWQELNGYKTSPYLADSDSDRVPDNIEIARGTDPNCAEGEVCGSVFGAAASGTSTASAENLGSSAPSGGVSAGIPPRDPEAIRTFLRMRGMSDAEIAQYSDEMILQSYDAAAQGGNGAAGTNEPSSNGTTP